MIIIDADGHVLDQESVYRQRLPEQFRKRQSSSIGDGFDRQQNGCIRYPPVTVERYLQDADLEGIDVMVLYPTGGLDYTRLHEHDHSFPECKLCDDTGGMLVNHSLASIEVSDASSLGNY
jgi:hypothetical protein